MKISDTKSAATILTRYYTIQNCKDFQMKYCACVLISFGVFCSYEVHATVNIFNVCCKIDWSANNESIAEIKYKNQSIL